MTNSESVKLDEYRITYEIGEGGTEYHRDMIAHPDSSKAVVVSRFKTQMLGELGSENIHLLRSIRCKHIRTMHVSQPEPAPPPEPEITLQRLIDRVAMLVQEGWYHKRRGHSLKLVPVSWITNHLIEEAVELQAESLLGDERSEPADADEIAEASDLLAVLLHLFQVRCIEMPDVIAAAWHGLDENFVFDQAQCTAVNPGYGRKGRPPT